MILPIMITYDGLSNQKDNFLSKKIVKIAYNLIVRSNMFCVLEPIVLILISKAVHFPLDEYSWG